MYIFRTLRADEIDCRVDRINERGVALLLYKDARCDQNILDETVGPFNWKRSHSRENANCTVSIWDETKHEWVSKEDTGTESNTEAAKGLASDSFKRACVNWGIGRELYTSPSIWVTDCNIDTGKNGKLTCYDKFEVSKIEYTEQGTISALEIINAKTAKTVFSWKIGKTVYSPGPEPKTAQSGPQTAFVAKCADCGAEIPDNVHDFAVKYYGTPLCRNCQKNHARK